MGEFRATIQDRLKTLFENYESPEEIAESLEHSIYNHSIKTSQEPTWENENFVACYRNNALKVISNLSTNPNAPLIWQMIDDGELEFPDDIVTASSESLDPERWEKARQTVIDKVMFENPDPETMPDGEFQCRKCKSWKTTYYQQQVRSCDEPQNVYVSCYNPKCKYRFRAA